MSKGLQTSNGKYQLLQALAIWWIWPKQYKNDLYSHHAYSFCKYLFCSAKIYDPAFSQKLLWDCASDLFSLPKIASIYELILLSPYFYCFRQLVQGSLVFFWRGELRREIILLEKDLLRRISFWLTRFKNFLRSSRKCESLFDCLVFYLFFVRKIASNSNSLAKSPIL